MGNPLLEIYILKAFHAGGNIHIQVEDDGAGLNREAIIKKALEKGLIRSEEGLSEREVWNLIFEPGFFYGTSSNRGFWTRCREWM
jgi:two-component system chemotaxis sensor kinase CheA